ncbi:MAG: DNA-binding protein [Gammaproteobacteria bacterium HGW-Gammaproteobacteria-11]|nr:MAG: DNA-binding protein [Gammaproteobacteria bacterium HGW-Gammaproteobacteria-11]
MKALVAVSVLLLLVVAVTLHVTRLDALLWHGWQLAGKVLPDRALDLGRYRVDIEGRPIVGVADDLSALTFNSETGTLWSVLNGLPLLVEISLDGALLRQIAIDGVRDMEGLTHVSGNRFVIAEERTQRLIVVDIPPQAERINVEGAPSLKVGLDLNDNKGFEGASWDAVGRRLLVVKERDPLRVLAVTGFVDAPSDAPMAVRITELKPPDSSRLFMTDLSSLTLHDASGHLLLLSDESHMLVEYDADGEPLSLLGLWRGMSGLQRTVPQAEGVAVDDRQRIYLVSEPNLFYRFAPQH